IFVGKVYLFYGAVQNGLWWLALAGALNSFVSIYYYMRPVRLMFVREPSEAQLRERGARPPTTGSSISLRLALTAAATAVLVLGVVPSWVINQASDAARSLTP
ncbi:MAG: hypothetical protein O3B84_05545, partial [Chloroflexi bacterium]|nr:hypothetical protein [Chloroflexota bacterium]